MATSNPVNGDPLDAQVLDSTEVDEGALRRLLRRAGRTLARPALECLELLLDGKTPPQVRITMVAALTYLLVPLDLIPDFIPVLGYLDDLVLLPLGIALALGRRSTMPVIKFVCVLLIEFIRGVPLITVLVMANTMLPKS